MFLVTDSGNLRAFMPPLFLAVPAGVTCADTYCASGKKKIFLGGWLFVLDINPLNDWPYSCSPRVGEHTVSV